MLLKRGMSATIEEFLAAAEYILAEGNPRVILCERGIRTFERATRNTLDLSVVPLIREMSHLPIIVDPSHATGKRSLVAPMAKAALVVGAHGIMVEVHPDPDKALCDGAQSLDGDGFSRLMAEDCGRAERTPLAVLGSRLPGRRVITVISGRQNRRTGRTLVPMPRLT